MKKRFIFDENYIKKYAKKDKMKWLIVGVSLLVLIIIIIIVILANRGGTDSPVNPIVPVFELKEELVLESGDTLPLVVDYFTKLENIDVDSIEVTYPEEFEISYDNSMCSTEEIEEMEKLDDFNPEDYECVSTILKTPTTYGVTISILDKEYTVNLKIVDTTSPVIITKNVEIYEGEEYKLEDFVKLCFDVNDDCEVKYYDKDLDKDGQAIDYSKISEAGTYIIKLVGTDKYGNVSLPVETELKIIKPEVELYTVTFNSNGGNLVEAQLVEDGKTVNEPVSPIKEGYKFLGWYIGNQKYDFNTIVNKNIILMAKWEKIEESHESTGNESGSDNPSIINVSSVSLNYKKIYLYVGDNKTVTATVKPTNATNKTVTWKSSDSSIAKVENGKITGLKVGTTTVTATAGGKSATVAVEVKEKTTTSTCKYGDNTYNTSKYILSVNLSKNNCAVNPNITYNETVSSTDYKKLVDKLSSMGFKNISGYFEYKSSFTNVKNNSGTGLVGYQIKVTLSVKDPDNSNVMSAEYYIKPDGSRQFISNNIAKNGVKFS